MADGDCDARAEAEGLRESGGDAVADLDGAGLRDTNAELVNTALCGPDALARTVGVMVAARDALPVPEGDRVAVTLTVDVPDRPGVAVVVPSADASALCVSVARALCVEEAELQSDAVGREVLVA